MINRKGKILIIEDDESVSLMYRTKFIQDGFMVITAGNGARGLEMAIKDRPDIILLDLLMPELDGFSVLKQLKANKGTKNIPVIILTVLSDEESKLKGERLGAIDYIVKSYFTPSEIYEKIKEILDR
jgi:DNA-binding response OmpR family regulator